MQPITKNGEALEPLPFDVEKMKEILNDPEIKEVRVFKPRRGMTLEIRGVIYKIVSVSKNGSLHLERAN
ncbi:MAG: hypothetical protein JW908_00710 [Anaerolineales bacterium]|nr:hypothetical protein [Anaerolineales bacterium]